MTTTATSRRPQANLHAMSDNPRSPLRSSHHTPTRTTTPRPSISPLSTASRPAKGSPVATRDAIMADSELQDNAEAGDSTALTADDMRDDRSSSLSEPEDDEDMENMPEHTIAAPLLLGKLGAQKSADVDSEAETERLEESPQKMREQADGIGRTPSKLRQAAVADDELSDPPSPLPPGAGAASSTSTVATGGRPFPNAGDLESHSLEQDDSNALGIGQKRKRSDAEDSPLTSAESDIGESPRKRSHELAANTTGNEEQAVDVNGLQEEEAEPNVRATPGAQSGKLPKGKKGKQKGRKGKEQTEPLEADNQEQSKEAEEEPSEEAVQKTEEELKKKGEASSNFEGLVKQFMAFRDRLVNERLATIEDELQMLNQPICEHPEYLRQIACIEERQAKQFREAHAYYYYRMQATRERALGDRAQLHSQYFQEVRELREDVLYNLGEDWYAIQRERRQQHQDGDEKFLYMYRPKKSAQIKQQAKYNQEVSVLSGMAKYVGFPAAPDIAGVDIGGLEDDFKAMKVPRRVPQPVPHVHHFPQPQPMVHAQQQRPQQIEQHPPPNQVVRSDSERRAHDQFLEQNAWARPQQSAIPAHGTPNLTHTSDWVDQPSNPRNLFRTLSGHAHSQQYSQRNGSPFATPLATKRAASAFSAAQGQPGEGDYPSSAMAAPHTAESEPRAHEGFTGSPLMVAKQRVNGNSNGTVFADHDSTPNHGRELTGFRNISNISGTSTIDAPLSAEKVSNSNSHDINLNSTSLERQQTHDLDGFARPVPPPFREETSAPQQVFETSSLHRHPNASDGGNGRDVYGGGQFRVNEGTFGTPAPLTSNGGT